MRISAAWICTSCNSSEKNLDIFCKNCFAMKPKTESQLYGKKTLFDVDKGVESNQNQIHYAVAQEQIKKMNSMDKDFMPSSNFSKKIVHTVESFRKQACGLCAMEYSRGQLQGKVSYRLVLNWKILHGVEKPSSKNKSFTRLYDITHLCVFCFQFFDDAYQFIDVEKLERKIEKSLQSTLGESSKLEAQYDPKKLEKVFNRPISRMNRAIMKENLAMRSKKVSNVNNPSFILRSKTSQGQIGVLPRLTSKRREVWGPAKRAFITEPKTAPAFAASLDGLKGLEVITRGTRDIVKPKYQRRSQSLGRNLKLSSSVLAPKDATSTNKVTMSTRGRAPVRAAHVPRPVPRAKSLDVRMQPLKRATLQPLVVMLKRKDSVVERKEATATLGHESLRDYVDKKRSEEGPPVSQEHASKIRDAARIRSTSLEKTTTAEDRQLETNYMEDWEDVDTLDMNALPISEHYDFDFEPGDDPIEEVEAKPARLKSLQIWEPLSISRGKDEGGSLRRSRGTPGAKFIRGGSIAARSDSWSGTGRRPSIKTPKLRSRVGDGIEPNFLELFDSSYEEQP